VKPDEKPEKRETDWKTISGRLSTFLDEDNPKDGGLDARLTAMAGRIMRRSEEV
jgi:hypothetical protein